MSYAKALYDYSNNESSIQFKTNEMLVVLNKVNEGWWDVETTSQQRGIVPSNFLNEMPLPENILNMEKGERESMVVKAKRSYMMDKDTHLNFQEGDLINIIEICYPKWWIGEMRDDPSKLGVVPSAFVEIINIGNKLTPKNNTKIQKEEKKEKKGIKKKKKKNFFFF